MQIFLNRQPNSSVLNGAPPSNEKSINKRAPQNGALLTRSWQSLFGRPVSASSTTSKNFRFLSSGPLSFLKPFLWPLGDLVLKLLRPSFSPTPSVTSTVVSKPTVNSLQTPMSPLSTNAQGNNMRSTNTQSLFHFFTSQFLGSEADIEMNKEKAFQITSRFEAPSPSALQTIDDGIVSYGLFQATVRSGALREVLKYYGQISDGPTAKELTSYLPRLEIRDESLRTDNTFLGLLKAAGKDPSMIEAQTHIQTLLYWNPAVRQADLLGYHSALTQAAFYDTSVQGGLQTILNRTKESLRTDYPLPNSIPESLFLQNFLAERAYYLLEIAERKRLQGKETQAQMLELDANRRIEPYLNLLAAGDLEMSSSFNAYLQ